jgi:hypothetical protein
MTAGPFSLQALLGAANSEASYPRPLSPQALLERQFGPRGRLLWNSYDA